jgi:hypothetical protein
VHLVPRSFSCLRPWLDQLSPSYAPEYHFCNVQLTCDVHYVSIIQFLDHHICSLVLNPVGFTLSTCSTLSTLVSPLIELSSKHQNSQESFQVGRSWCGEDGARAAPFIGPRERDGGDGKRRRARHDGGNGANGDWNGSGRRGVRGRLGHSGGVVAEAGASLNGEATGREALGGERAGEVWARTTELTVGPELPGRGSGARGRESSR